MKALLVLIAVGAALGAPAENTEELLRAKKSFGSGYAAPCAGGTPLAPVALYLSPQSSQHYREDEHTEENMDHHNEQHNEHARSYGAYGAPVAAAPLGVVGAGAGAAAAGSAIGLFPGAKVGNCAVPLLLSCAPSVHSGHLAHQAYGSPAYRAQELAPAKMRESTPSQQWTDSARANAPAPADHAAIAAPAAPAHPGNGFQSEAVVSAIH